jgi:hypothetical protein
MTAVNSLCRRLPSLTIYGFSCSWPGGSRLNVYYLYNNAASAACLGKLNHICKELSVLLVSHSALVTCMPHSMSKRQLADGGFSLLLHLLFDVCGDVEDSACWHIAHRTPAAILLVPIVLQRAVLAEVVPTPGHLHSQTGCQRESSPRHAASAAAGRPSMWSTWVLPVHVRLHNSVAVDTQLQSAPTTGSRHSSQGLRQTKHAKGRSSSSESASSAPSSSSGFHPSAARSALAFCSASHSCVIHGSVRRLADRLLTPLMACLGQSRAPTSDRRKRQPSAVASRPVRSLWY